MDVSLIVPTYQCGSYLKPCIDSLLNQDMQCRVVVVDDGSTDDTQAVLGEYGDQIYKLRHDRNRGANAARNTGLNFIEEKFGLRPSSFVSFCDADAVYRPYFAESLCGALSSNMAAVAYGYWEDERSEDSYREMRLPEWDVEALWWEHLTIPMPSMIRALMLPSGGLDETSRFRDDWKLWMWIAERGNSGVLVRDYVFRHKFRRDGKTISNSADPIEVAADRARTRRKYISLSRLPSPLTCLLYDSEDGSAAQHCLEHLEDNCGIPLSVIHASNEPCKTSFIHSQVDPDYAQEAIQGEGLVLLLRDDARATPDMVERLAWWMRMMPDLNVAAPLLLDDSPQSLLEIAKNGSATDEIKQAAEMIPDYFNACRRLARRRQLFTEIPINPCCAITRANLAHLINLSGSGYWCRDLGQAAAIHDGLCLVGEASKSSYWSK